MYLDIIMLALINITFIVGVGNNVLRQLSVTRATAIVATFIMMMLAVLPNFVLQEISFNIMGLVLTLISVVVYIFICAPKEKIAIVWQIVVLATIQFIYRKYAITSVAGMDIGLIALSVATVVLVCNGVREMLVTTVFAVAFAEAFSAGYAIGSYMTLTDGGLVLIVILIAVLFSDVHVKNEFDMISNPTFSGEIVYGKNSKS